MQQQYDFFEDKEQEEVQPQVNSAQRDASVSRDTPFSYRWSRIVAAIAAILAVSAGILACTRAVAPGAVGLVKPYSVHILTNATIVFAVGTLILVVVARVSLPNVSQRHNVGAGSITCAILALVFAGGAWVVSNQFPEGIIKPAVMDSAPISDVGKMEKDIEQTVGACPGGWQDVNANYPGVGEAMVCKETRVAFATFDNDTSTSVYQSLVAQQASTVISNVQPSEASHKKWLMLTGKRWIVVGEQTTVEKLQKIWGGTSSSMSS